MPAPAPVLWLPLIMTAASAAATRTGPIIAIVAITAALAATREPSHAWLNGLQTEGGSAGVYGTASAASAGRRPTTIATCTHRNARPGQPTIGTAAPSPPTTTSPTAF